MRPKKIYISAKALEQPTTKDGEPKAMRVKTFPSKGDVEYVDLSQVWKPFNDVPATGGWLLCMLAGSDKKFMTLYVSPLQTIEQMEQWVEYAFEKNIVAYIEIEAFPV